jgi:Bacterial Ig-like domain (group 3)/Beta-propeller repeat
MKCTCLICLFICLTASFLICQSSSAPVGNPSTSVASPERASQADPKVQSRILDSYGKLPLGFEANQGQADGRVKFLSRSGGFSLFLTGDEAVFTFGKRSPRPTSRKVRDMGHPLVENRTGGVLRMKLRNASSAAKVSGVDELSGTSNYFIGHDPAQWRTNIPTYAKVKYEGVYSGIDLIYYGNQRQLEYDFVVAPGADPRRIAFDVSGAKQIRQDAQGDLVLKMYEGEIRWHKPVVYQEKEGTRREIASHYVITDKNRVGFELAKYDATKPLYIDPLLYSTYLGGTGSVEGTRIALDSIGNAYLTGTVGGAFPIENPLQSSQNDNYSAFVTKINPAGSALVYSTYMGGSGVGVGDSGSGIAADGSGNAYVAGLTSATDFPTTPGAFQTVCKPSGTCGFNAFVAKINATGSELVYSTYLSGDGGSQGLGIAVDKAGHAYVTGYAGGLFPTTPGAFQTSGNGGFVTKLNAKGSGLVYSSYLSTESIQPDIFSAGPMAIAVDPAGNAYVTGSTSGHVFLLVNALQPTYGGGISDAFVAKINPKGSALVYATYLGGSGDDAGRGVAADSEGNAYVTGWTCSADFPTMNPWQPANGETSCSWLTDTGSTGNAFVAKINPTGSALVYSTYLGGSGTDGGAQGNNIALDSAGSAYVTGATKFEFPQKSPLQNYGGHVDAFVTKFNPTGSALVYSTYLGGSGADAGSGIAVDSTGNAYVTGETDSTNFPTTSGAFQTAFGSVGGTSAFVTKIFVAAATTTTLSSSPNPSAYGQAVTFSAVVTSVSGAPPNGETVTFMKGTAILGTGSLSDGTATFTTSTLAVGRPTFTAVYGGDTNFGGSTSKQTKQVVTKATTTTTLTSSLNPSRVGQAVTFTATVAPQFTGTLTGSVTFYDGTTVLKAVTLSGGAAKYTTSTLTAGQHSITATYKGNSNFDESTSTPLTQTVN